jgi:hypothetical protein
LSTMDILTQRYNSLFSEGSMFLREVFFMLFVANIHFFIIVIKYQSEAVLRKSANHVTITL